MSATDWYQRAACRDEDPDLFGYDPATDPPATAEAAKAICADCPVTGDCLEFALRTTPRHQDVVGIYGGLTPAERRERTRPEQPRGLIADPDWASKTFAKAQQIGVTDAAKFYNVDRRTLQRAWQRHGLGPVDRPGRGRASEVLTNPELATRAFQLAREHRKVRAAVQAFGVDYKTLKAAWERHGLGHPLEGLSREQLQTERNRTHPWRRDEQVRRAQVQAAQRERTAPPAFPAVQPLSSTTAREPDRRVVRARVERDEERER